MTPVVKMFGKQVENIEETRIYIIVRTNPGHYIMQMFTAFGEVYESDKV